MYQLIDNGGPFALLPAAPSPAPYYTVTFRFPKSGRQYDWSYLYVPSRRMVRITSSGGESVYWRTAPQPVQQAFATIGKSMKPYRRPSRWPPR
jgi:hypothetical protein